MIWWRWRILSRINWLSLSRCNYSFFFFSSRRRHTRWINPDTEYEAGLERFVEQSLKNAPFIADLKDAMARVAPLGVLVSLSQALVKVASPGVPDYYQGTELLDFSLVDPDNRRPVDYTLRRKVLERGGNDKLHVIRKGLEVRRRFPGLFQGAKYTPLYADGGREQNIIAFKLSDGARSVVAVAPRLFASLMEQGDRAPLGRKAWGESGLTLEGRYVNVMTGILHEGPRVRLAELLGSFPVALLVRE